jgi:hypothetical protein
LKDSGLNTDEADIEDSRGFFLGISEIFFGIVHEMRCCSAKNKGNRRSYQFLHYTRRRVQVKPYRWAKSMLITEFRMSRLFWENGQLGIR